MSKYKFGACEYNFPVWGALAMEMAHEAGYDGIEITDGGGYLQPHPMNKGIFVECERFTPGLVRLDGYPLTDKIIQDEYMNARAKTGIEITGIHLYFLNHQGFVSHDNETIQGKEALETIKNAVMAASQMGIPLVTIPTKGMFGVAKNLYAFQKLEYAVKVAEEYGIKIANSFDTSIKRELEIMELLSGKLLADFNTADPLVFARENPVDMINELGGKRIAQIKIKDLKKDREGFITQETSEAVSIGSGDTEWKECLEAAEKLGFRGYIISDTPFNSSSLNVLGENYISLAEKDLDTLKKAFA